MSSIVWDISAEAATVAVDTLCTDGHGKPVGLISKAFIVPHLKLVIATTGNLQILEDYFLVLNSKPISYEGSPVSADARTLDAPVSALAPHTRSRPRH